jgi:hypothetical protein
VDSCSHSMRVTMEPCLPDGGSSVHNSALCRLTSPVTKFSFYTNCTIDSVAEDLKKLSTQSPYRRDANSAKLVI